MIGFYIYCGVLAGLTLLGIGALIRAAIEDNRRLTAFWKAYEPVSYTHLTLPTILLV